MSNKVTGQIQASINLQTIFGSGTAGTANDQVTLGTVGTVIGSSQPAGLVFGAVWSHTYTAIAASTPFTIDLTALPTVAGGTIDLSAVALRFFWACNSDPTAGHDVKVGPGASNGLTALFDSGTGFFTINGGMPGAGIVNNVPVGNRLHKEIFTVAGITVDSTHKTLTIDPGANTISSFTLVLAG